MFETALGRMSIGLAALAAEGALGEPHWHALTRPAPEDAIAAGGDVGAAESGGGFGGFGADAAAPGA